MTERPIIFSAPMVRAILAGTKTQTRRVMRDQPCKLLDYNRGALSIRVRGAVYQAFSPEFPPVRCPYGQPGDRLWVREAWSRDEEDGSLFYRADVGTGNEADDWQRNIDDGASGYRWKPSIHMPRWASRILLEVTCVRVERLHDISEADANAEGVKHSLHLPGGRFARENFAHLWWTIHGDGSWDANPWVWVVEFRKATP
jgi:hypothetical protein